MKNIRINAKNSDKWQEGLRGVLYRGIKDGFVKKLDIGLFSLPQYNTVMVEEEGSFLFSETADTDICVEGAKITIQVNKYERSSVARQKCIDTNGLLSHL